MPLYIEISMTVMMKGSGRAWSAWAVSVRTVTGLVAATASFEESLRDVTALPSTPHTAYH